VGDPETNHIWLLGVCHRRASAAVRERVSYEPAAVVRLLGAFHERMPLAEALVVSTCNRTEAYLAGGLSDRLPEGFIALHEELWPGSADRYEIMLSRVRRDDAAVEHLARVACGLESSIVGDNQILGQLRAAVSAASGAGTIGRWLGTASALALRAGRSVVSADSRSEPRGIPSAATDAIVRYCDRRGIAEPTVLILGAGTMAAAVAEDLSRRLEVRLRISARSSDRTEALAARLGATTMTTTWDSWPAYVAEASAVVCATGARAPVLMREHFEAATDQQQRPLVVDLGLPRNVDAAVAGAVDALMTLDDFSNCGSDADVSARELAVEGVARAWRDWTKGLRVEGIVSALYGDVDDVIAATVAQLANTGMNAEAVAYTVRRNIRALVDGHVRRLRADARDGGRQGGTRKQASLASGGRR
jgi:glutamyl-tRNA reductase